jgi:hypothetical protein
VKRSFVVVLAVTLVAASPAAAKQGAQARLLGPLPIHARAGTVITVKWTVDAPGPDGRRVPFGAIGMFVRLIGRNGAATSATAPQKHGPPYSARIRVPLGGIHDIQLGLHGWAITPSGKHPAPMLFPITNSPLHPTRSMQDFYSGSQPSR